MGIWVILLLLGCPTPIEAPAVPAPQEAEDLDKHPPVPAWKPDFSVSVEVVLERMIYYTDDGRDIVLFTHGTAVLVPEGLDDAAAKSNALATLSEIFNYHPDMNPVTMDDGNLLVQYNHPAYNVVIAEFAAEHMATIEERHLDGLATSEVLITGLGPNKFDELGMKALYGRTFMFMDAQAPVVVKVYRHGATK